MPAFGRRPEFDPRSRSYPIRTLLEPARALQTRIWPCPVTLDQGNIGACVGFAWAAELAAEPDPIPGIDNLVGMQLYNQAQLLDQWDDTPPQEGSSVIAGAKAVANSRYLTEYRWAFGIDDLLDTLSQHGPAVLGIPWYSGMMRPLADGRIYPTGSIVGGHAILAVGIAVDAGAVLLHNSWGPDWGQNGTAWIRWGDLQRLLLEDGEACIPVIRTPTPTPPPEPTPPPPEPEPPTPIPPTPSPEGCLPRTLRQWIRR